MTPTGVFVVCSTILIVVVRGEHPIKFDEQTLTNLRLSADRQLTLLSYDEFELFNEYQCAIECVKDKASCTSYTFDVTTKLCSLFNDSAHPVDQDITRLVGNDVSSSNSLVYG
jgi:hypothetical protein